MTTHHCMRAPSISLIIPAYNEASVIADTLRPFRNSSFEVIIVANGCHDETAAVARRMLPTATVLESPIGNKAKALNLGVMAARGEILVFLDADTITTPKAVRLLADTLTVHRNQLAYGQIHFDLGRSAWPVRHFYAAWQLNPYFDRGKVGAFFALRRRGLEGVGCFPNQTNDDEWVRRRFGHDARFCADAFYRVRAPRRLRDLIAVRRRVRRGNQHLAQAGIKAPEGGNGGRRLFSRLASRPTVWLGALIYAIVTLMARYGRSPSNGWERDTSNRISPDAPDGAFMRGEMR